MKELFVLLGDTFGDPVVHGIFTDLDDAKEAGRKRGTMFSFRIQTPDIHRATLVGTEFKINYQSAYVFGLGPVPNTNEWRWTELYKPDDEEQLDQAKVDAEQS